MNSKFLNRNRNSFFNNWWWTIDHGLLSLIICLLCISGLITLSASPAVAERIGVDQLYFIKKQFVYLFIAFNIMIFISFTNKEQLKKFILVGLVLCTGLLILTLLLGIEIKGAKRWINILGITIQSSEVIKPFFITYTAWLLTYSKRMSNKLKLLYSFISLLLILGLVVKQPDIGMSIIISSVWFIQIFIIGSPILWFVLIGFLGASALIIAYFVFPHVASRINSFLNPLEYENYQITKSIQAFNNAGWFGMGPGDGKVKQFLPDSHTDFIFPVIAEEYGFIACLLVIAIYFLVICRVVLKIRNINDHFSVLASIGLVSQIVVQALINIGVSLNLFPTKGMTLPFISYGGSSLISSAITIGILLTLTKKQFSTNLNMNRERWY